MREDTRKSPRGTVSSIWRYPVKSMAGEEIEVAKILGRGLAGDREFALRDVETGKIASAKSPRKWGRLLDARAAFFENSEVEGGQTQVQITLPDGGIIRSDRSDCNIRLSEWLERPVELRRSEPQTEEKFSYEIYTPDIEGLLYRNSVMDSRVSAGSAPGTFFNFAPIHIVTTASLRKLAELTPESSFEVQRFRPNLVIETGQDESDFTENDWMGQTLTIGKEVILRVSVACPRCVMTTLPRHPESITKDEKVLRTIVQHNRVDLGPYGVQACLGVYAEVLRGGTIHKGDKIKSEVRGMK